MSKKYYFLAGLPRSGSTVLSAILNQNKKIHSTATSGLIEIMGSACSSWENSPSTLAQNTSKKEIYRILKSIMDGKYASVEKEIVIDKNRGWVNPVLIDTMSNVLGYSPKIIATVRGTADCAASFVRLAKPVDLDYFLKNSQLINHLKSSYAELKMGFDKYPDNILFIEYESLVDNPKMEMKNGSACYTNLGNRLKIVRRIERRFQQS
jgi:sulfotransferase